jgi:UDP-2,3-diacylglucosamine pyrophosphatase LpxH
MANRYLAVSDLHLVDVEEHADGWMAYKASRYLFDDALDELVADFVDRADPADNLTLILNGDIFDFDLITAVPDDPPWPVSRAERKRGMEATASKSAWKLELILSNHQGFVRTLARFLADGHRAVCVMGNHDRELHFPEVQQVLQEAVARAASELGVGPSSAGALAFEPWFFYVPGEIYAEHGQQYDNYTSFRYQLWPVVQLKGEEMIALPMGNLSNRYLMTRMGFFNPHASDYILNIYSYIVHWLRHYAFSRRGIAITWLVGSLLVIARMFKIRGKLRQRPREHEERLALVARRFNLPPIDIETLGQLQRRPITSRMYRLIRELWIDRLLMAVLMTAGTVALALVPIPLWIKLMVPLSTFPAIYFIYERLAEGETIFTIEKEIPRRARAIAKMLPARVITFGHTHKPRQFPLNQGTQFVDTGTWAPLFDPDRRGELCPGTRTYLEVHVEAGGELRLSLDSWLPGDVK